MDVSVVVSTLNARDKLAACLDALTEHAGKTELIVVNGPSSDGTTGMVRDREDVDILIELADRTITAARNAGIDRATGDVVAFVDHTHQITPDWLDAIESSLGTADGVTGPTQDGSTDGDRPESGSIAGREVTFFSPGNVAFDRTVLDALDGFDEYLDVGSARDLAHRFAASDFDLVWNEQMETTGGLSADGGNREASLHWKYRSLAYQLVKNYGLRPTVVLRLCSRAGLDAGGGIRGILRGERSPSWWLETGREVVAGLLVGIKSGLIARRRDRSPRRNPHGRSTRTDRAVSVYDWR